MQTIHAMDIGKRLNHLAGFIALQMADQMPVYLWWMEAGNFGQGFLYAVLAKVAYPQIIRQFNKFHWLGFGDCYQGDLCRVALHFLCCFCYLPAHLRDVLSE